MKPNIFTKKEAEVLLGVSPSALVTLLDNGELEHSLVSGRVRISENQINSFKEKK